MSKEDSQATALRIVEEEIGRMWDSLCSNRLKVEEATSANLLGKLLVSLHNGPEGEIPECSLGLSSDWAHLSLIPTCLGVHRTAGEGV